MPQTPKHLVRTKELAAADAHRVRHPFNPNSDIAIWPLSERAGMQRAILSLARVPPGKESFLLHAHSATEEFVYILEGEGTAEIGEQKIKVGAGDFMGFPVDGTPHHLVNTGTSDLVYLMGGERTPLDIGHFPTIGKMIVFDMARGEITAVDKSSARPLTFADFVVAEDKA